MILEQIQNWKGAVEINGVKYNSMADALAVDLRSFDSVSIHLLATKKNSAERKETRSSAVQNSVSTVYQITVKQYMTKKSSPSFDFMSKWNNDIPMPLRTMVGTIEKETKGMVYMKLHGDIVARQVQFCMKCGKPLTNPVSQFFGMGPECGGHNYVNPFESEDELLAAVEQYRREYLQKITWEGWVIKSAIINQEVVQ